MGRLKRLWWHDAFFRAENRKGDDVVVKEVNKKARKIR